MNFSKSFLLVCFSLFVGASVNMSLIYVSGSVIPLPPGVDNTTTEGLIASVHLLQAKHYIFPFLAHAMGTLVAALIVSRFNQSKGKLLSLVIAGMFFLGGTIMVFSVPSPVWFSILDLGLAYFPMAMLGWKIAHKR